MTRPASLPFTAAELVALERSQHGVTEQPPDSNHVLYAVDQGIDGQPWCAALPGWAVDRLARRKGTWRALWASIGCQAPYYTPELVRAGRRAGWTVGRAQVRAGDLLFWDFPDAIHRVQHVDTACGPFRGSTVVTIGGNTSSDERGSQSNGGGVFERVRYSTYLVAAIRLPYAPATAGAHTSAPARPARHTTTEAIVRQLPQLSSGDRGQHVRNAQSLLNAHGAKAGAVDGVAGPIFTAAVRRFQRAHQLEVDGVIGAGETWPALLDVK